MRLISDYTQLVKENQNKIAEFIVLENGKTLADAKGDIFRGLEILEHAREAPTLLMGETMNNLTSDVDCIS